MIVGHQKNIEYFKNLIDKNSLFHSYIFFGKQWIGKKTFALSLANYLENKEFDIPKKILSDLFLIDSNNIKENNETILDEVRKIKNFLYQKPNLSFYKTVIIDNAENLTTYAQNALLKISEEPQSNSLIILICQDPELLLPTINSRFQKIYFENLKKEDVKNWLIKEFKINIKKADEISNLANNFPGIAYLMLNDNNFMDYFKKADLFLNSLKIDKVDFIKKIFKNENESENINFNPILFLDILMFILNNKKKLEKNYKIWKKILKLKMDLSYYNLNPKLQLVALANFIKNY
ncbi:MAG: hypothetical protein RMK17_02230 [bacterium]|nr:hypothetical protein [Patescibacteria group bacterium]MDW8279961.1 hypothetical protein [bacterium]